MTTNFIISAILIATVLAFIILECLTYKDTKKLIDKLLQLEEDNHKEINLLKEQMKEYKDKQ